MTGNRVRILGFAGSARRESLNKKLLRIAVRGAEQAGASVTVVDLRDLPLPIYDADLESEQGLPREAAELRRLLGEHEGLLVASPENNGSVSALLKNAIDWASRSEEGTPDPAVFRGRVAAILSASPGGLGGLRGLVHLRALLAMLGCVVLPDQFTLSGAHRAFDEAGELTDPRRQRRAEGVGAALEAFLSRLGSGVP